MLDYLSPKASDLIVTQPQSPRAASIGELLPHAKAKAVHQAPTVAEAIQKAEQLAGKEDLILVCGSLSVAREALRYWKLKIPRVC